jgi:hypothetical protein
MATRITVRDEATLLKHHIIRVHPGVIAGYETEETLCARRILRGGPVLWTLFGPRAFGKRRAQAATNGRSGQHENALFCRLFQAIASCDGR